MDLSKTAKSKRDAVEDPLVTLMLMAHELEEARVRVRATLKVYPETALALEPAEKRLGEIDAQLVELQRMISGAWKSGFLSKWK